MFKEKQTHIYDCYYTDTLWEDPEETQGVRISTQRSEDTRDVRTLQSIRDLHAKEPEAQVPQWPKA